MTILVRTGLLIIFLIVIFLITVGAGWLTFMSPDGKTNWTHVFAFSYLVAVTALIIFFFGIMEDEPIWNPVFETEAVTEEVME